MINQKGAREFRAEIWLKVFLSAWILFQLATICLMPNIGSYLGRVLPSWFISYSSSLGINTNWNFFSPDPAQTMYYHYRVSYPEPKNDHSVTASSTIQGDSIEPIQSIDGYYPTFASHRETSINKRRELYSMRALGLDERKIKLIFAPWVCRQFPGASNVEIEHVVETVAPLEEASRSTASLEELSHLIPTTRFQYFCDEQQDEVDL